MICMRFRLIRLVSQAFSNRCVFNENAQRISADGRPKRVELYAFSNQNALLCAGPKATLLLPLTMIPLKLGNNWQIC